MKRHEKFLEEFEFEIEAMPETWTTFDNKFLQKQTFFKLPVEKLLYMYLYSLRNMKQVFPSYKTIGIGICASVSTVQRAVDKLIDYGLLEKYERPGETHIYKLNSYIRVAKERELAEEIAAENEQQQEKTNPSQNDRGTKENVNPSQNDRGTQVKMTEVPKSKRPTISNSIKSKSIKNNITTSSKEEIDKELIKEHSPEIVQAAKELLETKDLKTTTLKQYKASLILMIKDIKKPKRSFTKQITREEKVPSWFNEREEANQEPELNNATSDIDAEREKLKAELAAMNQRYEKTY